MAATRDDPRVRHHGVPAGRQLLGEGRPTTDRRRRRLVQAPRRRLRRGAAQTDAKPRRQRLHDSSM